MVDIQKDAQSHIVKCIGNYNNIFRRNNVIHMELTLCNKALSGMTGFAIQLNKNSFGLTPAQPLNVPVLNANQTLGNLHVAIK